MSNTALDENLAQEAVKAFLACDRNKTAAASMLDLERSTFRNRLRKGQRYGYIGSIESRGPEKPHYEDKHIVVEAQPEVFPKAAQKKNGRILLDMENGTVLIGSDAHYWPNDITPAHRAFVKLCRELKPAVVIMNGDVFDGAGISRHAPIGWEDRPTVTEELEACKVRLQEIIDATPKAKHIWTLGNHDARFETRLASVAPEYARVHGVHLKDHFPEWESCWATWINDELVVKHRYKNGLHAAHNNTVTSGKSIATGHLHSLKVTPYSDYNGTRWGIDTGCLARPNGKQFVNYLEDGPVNWRDGFAVTTFHKGKLLWPEVCAVMNENQAQFRAQIIQV